MQDIVQTTKEKKVSKVNFVSVCNLLNEMEVVDNYIDRAYSAKTDNRPNFQKMIKDSAKGQFDVVIVWKLDRFARNRYDNTLA